MLENRPLVISGPSGIGKTTLSNQLETHGFSNVLKTTTRAPRPNEVNGIDYEFTDAEHFLQGVRNGEFIMDDHFYNNHYGIRRSEISHAASRGRVPMLQLHTPTIGRFLTDYPDTETVFMKPVDTDFLAQRLASRAQSREDYEYRLNQGMQELADYESTYQQFYRHELVVFSNDNTEHIEKIKTLYERPQGSATSTVE